MRYHDHIILNTPVKYCPAFRARVNGRARDSESGRWRQREIRGRSWSANSRARASEREEQESLEDADRYKDDEGGTCRHVTTCKKFTTKFTTMCVGKCTCVPAHLSLMAHACACVHACSLRVCRCVCVRRALAISGVLSCSGNLRPQFVSLSFLYTGAGALGEQCAVSSSLCHIIIHYVTSSYTMSHHHTAVRSVK